MKLGKPLTMLFILILALQVFSFVVFSPSIKTAEAQEPSPEDGVVFQTPPISWTDFWQTFRQHAYWSLEGNRGEGWENANNYLEIIRDYPEENHCKITLIFHAPITGDYRLTFAIDANAREYFHQEGSWNSYNCYSVAGSFCLVSIW